MTMAILLSALWLGILTSISPCPLASNIAAISFISRNSTAKKSTILSGVLYSLGRISAYVLLGVVVSFGLLASDTLSRFFQTYMNELLGPILILLGLMLLGLIGNTISFGLQKDSLTKKADKGGFWSIIIGFIFALSFCPVSAALFFGALIPLCITYNASVSLPILYGVGTALPVLIFATILTFASSHVSRVFNVVSLFELWFRRVTGIVFIVVGVYYSLVHVYGMG